jgi:Mlc titration factor MtfA (ptsG expression regulator)
MIFGLKQLRERRILKHNGIDEHLWQRTFEALPARRWLERDEAAKLRRLATLFLHDKSLETAQDLDLTEAMRVKLAAYACLPILKLGLDWYRGWYSVIVYPAGFVPAREVRDAAGVVHRTRHPLSGEAWQRGPVILSWDDIDTARPEAARNVIIHEMAHKLDMLNGSANGHPPLHSDMDIKAWSETFGSAYAKLRHALANGGPVALDAYAAQSPAEFFSVVSEVFFQQPDALAEDWPGIYKQLKLFYRQEPACSSP